MSKKYRVHLDVMCETMVKAINLKRKLIRYGVDQDSILIGPPIKDIYGNYLVKDYSLQIRTTSDFKKKIIKDLKLKKDPNNLYRYVE